MTDGLFAAAEQVVSAAGTAPAPAREAPSGRQVELVWGDQRLTVVEVGGGLRTYDVGGRAVLDGYPPDSLSTGSRGQLLVPWPNRIAGGRYTLDGTTMQLALTEAVKRNAIHGLTRWVAWEFDQPAAHQVRGQYLLRPQPGYPFALRCEVEYGLGDDGLTVTMAVTNRSARPAPVGLGAHPYLLVGGGRIDAAELAVPARTWLEVDDRSIPTGSAPVAGTGYDFRTPRTVGEQVLDTAYTDLIRDSDGKARVKLATSDGWHLTLWCDENWPYLQLFSGETLPTPERRRSIAVEPMTCAPNAFNTGAGLQLLEPDQALSGTWGIQAGAPIPPQ